MLSYKLNKNRLIYMNSFKVCLIWRTQVNCTVYERLFFPHTLRVSCMRVSVWVFLGAFVYSDRQILLLSELALLGGAVITPPFRAPFPHSRIVQKKKIETPAHELYVELSELLQNKNWNTKKNDLKHNTKLRLNANAWHTACVNPFKIDQTTFLYFSITKRIAQHWQ